MTSMRISVVQPDLLWESREANFKKIEEMMLPLYNETDLVILPEMFTTGFSMRTGLSEEFQRTNI